MGYTRKSTTMNGPIMQVDSGSLACSTSIRCVCSIRTRQIHLLGISIIRSNLNPISTLACVVSESPVCQYMGIACGYPDHSTDPTQLWTLNDVRDCWKRAVRVQSRGMSLPELCLDKLSIDHYSIFRPTASLSFPLSIGTEAAPSTFLMSVNA
jgi:hypothetical protein